MLHKIPVTFGLVWPFLFVLFWVRYLCTAAVMESEVIGFSQSILTGNPTGGLVPFVFQLCADRIKLSWWRLRPRGGLACSRNLAHCSWKQFVAVAAFDYGMFICFESPCFLEQSCLLTGANWLHQHSRACFEADTLLSLDKCWRWVSLLTVVAFTKKKRCIF